MKNIVLFIFLWFATAFAQEQYLKDLEELGYCVIPEVLSTSEAKVLYERVWHEYVEKAWPKCTMNDRSNWKETFPKQNKWAVFVGSAGQIQVMWDLRQDPRIVAVFAKIWNTDDLIVSMDGLCLMCPPEIREGEVEPWPHVDQAIMRNENRQVSHSNHPPADFVSESPLKTQPFTIQGQFLFEDSSDGDGGFYCIPRSHLRFEEFAPQLEALAASEMPREVRKKVKAEYLESFFGLSSDNPEHPYRATHITAPRGSLILWDSRTIHWNEHPSRTRASSDLAKVRMVGYLSYVPKGRLTEQGRMLRKEAFETGASTGHNPVNPELKQSKTNIWPEFEHYLEDPSYTQAPTQLTPLGESLLGW